MKNFHQSLLIVLALCLCGLCIYQWDIQMQQRKKITTSNQLLYDKAVAIQDYTNHIAEMDGQIAQMSKSILDLNNTIKSNAVTELEQRRAIGQLRTLNDSLTNDMAQYKEAVDKLEAKLKEAYEGIKKQNDAIKEVVAQRDEFVKKYNDSIKDRNGVVSNYNDLVAKYNDLVKGEEKKQSK
jgi:predicted RNase H-like nuclease (RuvC/YqgF family)